MDRQAERQTERVLSNRHRHRSVQERAAADAATSPEARLAHGKLADLHEQAGQIAPGTLEAVGRDAAQT